jgi:hypothetical protein
MGKRPETPEEQLLAELAKLQGANDEGFTTAEWAEKMGLTSEHMVKRIKALVMNGKMVIGERKVLKDWDGRARRYIVYRLTK